MKKMRDKWSGSRGAVSVFLAIILVPCMLFTCVFGDVSRVKLSQATATSAADLSLQALLSQYDPDLEQFYGLVASCQNVDDFFDKSEEYFKGMMQAQGLSEEYSDLFGSYMERELAELGGVEPSNFLKTQTTEEIVVGNVDNNSLGKNPALLQKSIVEFMKYRAPIGLVQKLLQRWSNRTEDGKLKDSSIEGIEINRETSEIKQEYAEAEAELMEKLFESYKPMKKYADKRPERGPSLREQGKKPHNDVTYQNLEKRMKGMYDDLETATQMTVRYYFSDADGLKALLPFGITDELPPASKPSVVVDGVEETVDGKKQKVYYLDAVELGKLTKDRTEKIQELEEKISQQMTAWDEMEKTWTGDKLDRNVVVYALKAQESSGELAGIQLKIELLMEEYGKVLGAKKCTPKELPEDWQSQLDEAAKPIKEWFNQQATQDFMETAAGYVSLVDGIKDKVDKRSFEGLMSNGEAETLAALTQRISGTLTERYNALGKQAKQLELAINGDGNMWPKKHVTPALDELMDAVKEYSAKREKWGNAVKDQETPYEEKEYDEYLHPGQTEAEKMTGETVESITPESVTELKTRLTNILDDIKTCRKAIEEFTYGGTKVMELKAENIIDAVRGKMPARSSESYAENDKAGSGYFLELINPSGKKPYEAPKLKEGKDGNDPDLQNDPPALYYFMKTKLNSNFNQIQETKDKFDDFKEQSNNAAEKAKEGAFKIERTNLGTGIVNGSGGTKLSVLSSIGILFSTIKNLTQGVDGLKNMRDNLYVGEYIMSMFDHYTTDNEGIEHWGYSKEQWEKDSKTEVMENQTLTNRHFCLANNHANRAEVEYILYGSNSDDATKNIDDCLTTAFKNLYEIRLTLDTTSGFCLFYSLASGTPTGAVINSIAGTIAAASGGIVPIPATKTVLILALAGLEAAADVATLKEGKSNPFYKSEEAQWKYSMAGGDRTSFPDMSSMKGSGNTVTKPDDLYYSDYMYVFVMLAMQDDAVRKAALNRMADLIEANMVKAGKEGFNMDKARTHFQLKGQLRVDPLMLTLPIVDSLPEAGGVEFRDKTDWCTYNVKVIRGYS